MRGPDGQQIAVASVYASSLHDLADQRGVSERVLADLERVEEILDTDGRLEGFFASPLVEGAERAAVIDKLFGGALENLAVDPLLVDTLQVMNRKGRLGLVRALVAAYRRESDRRAKRVEVRVTTAVPLSETLRADLIATLNARGERRTVRLIESVDDSIIGGLIVQAGDRKYDHSVARDLAQMSDALSERTSQEIQSRKSYVIES